MQVQGQCYYGAIAYEAQVEPGTATACHCTDCQVHSGSAFRTNIAPPAAGFSKSRHGTPMPPWRFELSAQDAAWLVARLRDGIR